MNWSYIGSKWLKLARTLPHGTNDFPEPLKPKQKTQNQPMSKPQNTGKNFPNKPVNPGRPPVNRSIYDGCAKKWAHPAAKDTSNPAMTAQNRFRNPKSVTGQ
jgi:hypothetical protein